MTSPAPLDGVIARLVSTVLAAVLAQITEAWAVATVQTVTAGAAKDGNALVTVKWRGQANTASYASSYTPVAGHVVLCARHENQLVIVCRVIGTP